MRGDHMRQRGFAAAGRAIKNAGRQPVRLHGAAQQPPRPQQMLLPIKLVQRARAHALGQRRILFDVFLIQLIQQRHDFSSIVK